MASSLIYFVEGECEKAFIRSFMLANGDHFKPGKIEIFNFINDRLSKAKARTINKDMIVAIVFDTDVNNIEVMEENIRLLKSVSLLDDSHIIFVPSVKNFEDEIVYSTSKIKTIHDLFKTKSIQEFKKKFIAHKDIVSKLEELNFDIKRIWTRNGASPFDRYKNSCSKIKV